MATAAIVGTIAFACASRAQEPPDRPHADRPEKRDDTTRPTGTGTLHMPATSMDPTVPAGATVQVDYDAYRIAPPTLNDIVILRPPRGVKWSGRCGVSTSRRPICPRPVRRLSKLKFHKRVVGLPGDRLRMRGGLITRNGEPPAEPFANVSDCKGLVECDFSRAITVPSGHFFVLGDNRGQSDDSRFWGPVPTRALLAKVTSCTTKAGEPCGS
jgi:signal peptidase I